MSTPATWARSVAGLLAGAATAAAPFVWIWRLDWRPLQTTGVPYFGLLLGPVVAGGLVALLVARKRGQRRWWLGAVLGCLLGAVAAGFYFGKGGDVPQEPWLQVLLSLCFAALGAVAGSVGGVLGWGVGWSVERVTPGKRGRKLKSWQLGAAIAGSAVAVFGVLATLAGT